MEQPARPWPAPSFPPRRGSRRSGREPLLLRILAGSLALTVMSSAGLFLYSVAFLQLGGWAEIATYWAAGLFSAKLWLGEFIR